MSPHSESDKTPAAVQMADDTSQSPRGLTGYSLTVDLNNPMGNLVSPTAPPVSAEAGPEPVGVTVGKKKKKKKSKGKSKNKAALPSGFEENFADAPMTPAEYAEETNHVYHPSRNFTERIESCLHRYRARRRFDALRKDIFDKYLSLGGIDTSPKQFTGGVDQLKIEEMNANEIATVTGTDAVGRDKDDAGKEGSAWVVDFEAIAKCFFSSRVPYYFDLETPEQMAQCVRIIRNFLNYLLYHNVCPEFKDQINAARTICDIADHELPATKQFSMIGPGDFNIACSTVYQGHYHGTYESTRTWAKDPDFMVGMSNEQATKVISAALAAYGTKDQIQHIKDGKPVFVTDISSPTATFEITSIHPADSHVRELYATNFTDLKPLGRIRARDWVRPYGQEEDMTDDEGEDDGHKKPIMNGSKQKQKEVVKEYEFFLEDPDLLENCFVGMKIEATIRKLNIGVGFFDALVGCFASFYINLPNEMMNGWREPQAIVGGKGGRDLEIDGVEEDEEENAGGVAVDGND
ncbi:MAG: hypothetical protein M1816_003595 [Peltula sp. TS41687]|nr:MAG: hypothetical protein M1816_003595 [Peltula sp. TS41687]